MPIRDEELEQSLRTAAPHVSTEDHVVKGWSALERHDLAAARAVLQSLYDLDPRHPALPLLASTAPDFSFEKVATPSTRIVSPHRNAGQSKVSNRENHFPSLVRLDCKQN